MELQWSLQLPHSVFLPQCLQPELPQGLQPELPQGLQPELPQGLQPDGPQLLPASQLLLLEAKPSQAKPDTQKLNRRI